MAHGLARQLRIPFVNLKTFPFRADVVKLLPESSARRFRALVLEDKGDTLLVALSDPLDLFAYDELTRLLKRNISIAAVPESQLALAFDRLYRRTEEISGLARALEKDLGDAVDFGELTASVGLELWLSAVAYGARQVLVMLTDEEAPQYKTALMEQMAVAQSLLNGLGYEGLHFELLQVGNASSLDADLQRLSGRAVKAPAGPALAARHAVQAEKRSNLELTLDHLMAQTPIMGEPSRPAALTLPAAGSPLSCS